MAGIFGNTMDTNSSSEQYASSFQSSQEVTSEGQSGSEPVVTQQNQIASVSYMPGDVAKPNQTEGEVSIALPLFTPKHTMAFQNWKSNGWDFEGGQKTNPSQEDYQHEPSIKDANMNEHR